MRPRLHKQARNRPAAKKAVIAWFKRHEPVIYKTALAKMRAQQQVNGLAAIPWGSFFSTLTSTVSNLAPAYIQARQQKKIMDTQLKRAAQGLPPIDVQAYTPAVKIQPEFTPESEAAMTRVATQTATDSLTKILPFVGIGFAAIMLLKKR